MDIFGICAKALSNCRYRKIIVSFDNIGISPSLILCNQIYLASSFWSCNFRARSRTLESTSSVDALHKDFPDAAGLSQKKHISEELSLSPKLRRVNF